MEIKDGYKLTEIGVIPEDWEIVTYDEAFHFLSTASYSRSQISTNGDIGYIHYGDIHKKWKHFLDINKEQLPFISNKQLKTYSILKEGDLIMADASEDYLGIGESVEVKNIGNKNIISGLHTFLLRGKDGVFVNGFKGYIHSNKTVKNQFDRLATGLKVYGVTKTNLKKVKIPLPPLPEQKAIAKVLSDMDNLITGLERQIEKKRLVKQGAMQRLLTAGEDWEVRTLGDILEKTQLGGNYPNKTQKTSFPLIKMGNLGRGYIKLSKLEYIPRNTNPSKEDKLYFGDVLFNTRNTLDLVGKVAIWKDELSTAYFNSNIMRLIFRKEFISSNFFMNYVFNKKSTIKQLRNIATGTTSVAAIYTRDLLNIKIDFPPLSEQTRIATILSDMDKSIASLAAQLSKYRAVKVGLMQALLSGRKRLIKH